SSRERARRVVGAGARENPCSFGGTMKLFADLARNECRFVVADATLPGERRGSSYMFCAARAMTDKPYCQKHWSICHILIPRRHHPPQTRAFALELAKSLPSSSSRLAEP